MEFKGTKGEWYLKKGESLIGVYCEKQQVAITNSVNRLENAKLIASAPDLLEALQDLMRFKYSLKICVDKEFQTSVGFDNAIEKCEKAIEKALK